MPPEAPVTQRRLQAVVEDDLTIIRSDQGVPDDELSIRLSETTRSPGIALVMIGSAQASQGVIVRWEWPFGDGTSSTEQNPDPVYDEPGACEVTLAAATAAGATDTLQMTVDVE